MKYKCTKLIAS